MSARRTHTRSCNELGVCQARAPACHGCTVNTHDLPAGSIVFAPGVIEGPGRRRWLTPRRMDALVRALLVLALLGTLSATLGFAAGYLTLGGML
jgi:hypothetical protein